MSRKPRFKVQRKNDGGRDDKARFGNKQWTIVYDDDQRLGFTLTFEQATGLYWEMSGMHPDQTYRIVERR